MIFAGIDVGTTRCKLTVFDNGKELSNFHLNYESKTLNKNESVVDPLDILHVVKKLISQAYQAYPNLMAVGITSFAEAFVCLDEKDNPLYDTMLYSDPRGREEAKELKNLFTDKKLAELTGQVSNPMFSLEKLLYIKKHNPEVLKKTKRICLIEDYLVYMLSGVQQMDFALACRTMSIDIKHLSWSREILDKVGIDYRLFSRLVEVGTIAGELKKDVALEMGVSSSIKVITGAHDQIAAALGVGLWTEGDGVDGAGTCECLTPLYSDLSSYEALCEQGFGIIPYPRKGKYVSYGMITTCGALLDWFVSQFCKSETEKGLNPFDEMNKQISSLPTDIFVLPYFAGSGCPYMDPLASGAIVNLNLGTSRGEIYQGVLESLSYELRMLRDSLIKDKAPINRLFASGGGARNDKWLQIKADVLGIPFYTLENPDTGTVGSGIIIGKALGLFSGFEDGIKQMVKVKKEYKPDLAKKALYDEKYEKYLKVYKALKPLE
ncbi:MAG: FGGY family carbohydrate kinase [Bacilli bacterium]|jgi:xylulokinase|nr:FGGY family carbohydrate kinase [Bacilli bacterium]